MDFRCSDYAVTRQTNPRDQRNRRKARETKAAHGMTGNAEEGCVFRSQSLQRRPCEKNIGQNMAQHPRTLQKKTYLCVLIMRKHKGKRPDNECRNGLRNPTTNPKHTHPNGSRNQKSRPREQEGGQGIHPLQLRTLQGQPLFRPRPAGGYV